MSKIIGNNLPDMPWQEKPAGYELEYPDGRAVCVFYNPWEKEALQKLPEGNWKLLCDGKRCAEDGAEMKESMMLPAKSMVLLARE